MLRGYDDRFHTYCPLNAPQIREMSLEEAKQWVRELYQDFPFGSELSATLAIARLLTPFCRGIMGSSARPPVWLYEANRARAGKDYLGGCTLVLYEGRANEDPPLDSDAEETRKQVTAALQSGRRFM